MKINRIGWQKYEDLLHSQMDSPFLDSLYNQMVGEDDYEEDDYEPSYDDDDDQERMRGSFVVPVSERLMESVSLATSFDCWMGHTNFNITEETRESLSETAGVEVLKICSRYRFFVGIGRMFDFAEVRKAIEKSLGDAKGESKNEQEDRQVLE